MLKGGWELILGTANHRVERQSVIKKTVCGSLGKKCLGVDICGGGYGALKQGLLTSTFLFFLKGLSSTARAMGVIW